MRGSQRDDHLLRQIQAVAAMLARILGLRTSGRLDEAKAELESAYAVLLDARGELVRRVDARTAATMLGSVDAIVALAELTREEAELEADADRRAALHRRARELATEAQRRDLTNEAAARLLEGAGPDS